MSAEYDVVNAEFFRVMRSAIAELHQRKDADCVTQSLLCFLVRLANTWNSLHLLRQGTPAEFQSVFMVDAGVLLRCMFDAYLQADYIVREPAKRMERATMYLEFQHVERHKVEEKVFRHNNPLTDMLSRSPRRAEGQIRTKAEFDRVKGRFLRSQRGCGGRRQGVADTREHWYESNLGKLAEDAGKKAEYDTFVYSFSGCVHSSSYVVLGGPPVTVDHVLQFASTLAARVVSLNIIYNALDIGGDRPFIDEMCKGLLNKD